MLRTLRAGLVSVAALAIVSGTVILFFKELAIIPILRWIQSLTPVQMDLYISVWGRALIGIGIVLFLFSSVLFWLRRRMAR